MRLQERYCRWQKYFGYCHIEDCSSLWKGQAGLWWQALRLTSWTITAGSLEKYWLQEQIRRDTYAGTLHGRQAHSFIRRQCGHGLRAQAPLTYHMLCGSQWLTADSLWFFLQVSRLQVLRSPLKMMSKEQKCHQIVVYRKGWVPWLLFHQQ